MAMKVLLSCTLICCLQIISQIGAASLDGCSSVFGPSVKKHLCGANSYQSINGADLDKTLDCVLKATNIVDKTGAGNFYSLYDPMQVYLKDGRTLNFNLESCMTRRLAVATRGENSSANEKINAKTFTLAVYMLSNDYRSVERKT
uniref:Putative d7 short n=1 Tax=Anopheles darlingi TaxID=43151 RepID=A0A2M4CZV9_ANODA